MSLDRKETQSPPPYEEALQTSAKKLQGEIATYQGAEEEQGHGEPRETEAQRVAAAMQDVGNSHADPKVRADWHKKAKQFSRASKKTRDEILKHVGKVVCIVLSIPCVVVGTSLHIAGGAIHAAGSVVGRRDPRPRVS